jgi:2-oxoglutarate dehydrogenase complex dehydrogenase (E1) component-like enzyme
MWARRSLQPQPEGILQDHRIRCIARSQRASPAAGEVVIKDREQFKLMNDAFG